MTEETKAANGAPAGVSDSTQLLERDWCICNMRRGTGHRASFVYAELRDSFGKLVIAGDLEYIVNRVNKMT